MAEYDPHKTTREELVERKAPETPTFHLYHGTDVSSGEKIRTEGLKLITGRFHDFAMGPNTAFYLTTSRDLAIRFAKERAATTEEKAGALVTVTLKRSAVKLYEFDGNDIKAEIEKWKELVDHNRDRNRKGKEQHPLVKTHDVIGGWISTVTRQHGRVPVAYVSDKSGKHYFDWQYVAVSAAGLHALSDVHVESVSIE